MSFMFGGYIFEITTDAAGKPAALRVLAYGFELETFDRVNHAIPSEAEMQAMTGDYVSDEAETEFNVALTPKGLEIHQRPDIIYPLTPTYAGGFDSSETRRRPFPARHERSHYRTEPSAIRACRIFSFPACGSKVESPRGREDQQAKKPQSNLRSTGSALGLCGFADNTLRNSGFWVHDGQSGSDPA